MKMPRKYLAACVVLALAVLLLVAGLLLVPQKESDAPLLTLTYPSPERPESLLLVCGGVTAVLDPVEEDEDRLAVILQQRRIEWIDFVLTTTPRDPVQSIAGIRVGETVCLGECPDGIPIGDAMLRMQSGVPVLQHGQTTFDVLPLTVSHPGLRGASVLVSDGEKIRVQPDGSRWG